ncbi:shikimate kinase [Cupriavidus basilensis]|uniref:Shikimate kinase n=1 Tax=Cupriavidus basilensis TaxID=68895 RepID=A0ABT6APP1_9BURK|nr:shikimate kinase [Cupriavidus basilensis]MDF3834577.1 shikimate kinase [Cupriavidus basilensis]
MDFENIFFVGFMGAGKTTIGRTVARRLGLPFFDTDHEIEARCGVRIPTIFELEGEEGFRQRETRTLDELTQRKGIVLATGGGAVLRAENREMLRSRGYVIYLCASPAELWHRTRRDRNRPLLQGANPRATLEALYRVRDPLYRETAHLVMPPHGDSVAQAAARVLDRLGWGQQAMPPEESPKPG